MGQRPWGPSGAVRSDARAVLGRCCERDGTRCVEEERGVRGGARGAVAAAARLCAAEVHGWHALESCGLALEGGCWQLRKCTSWQSMNGALVAVIERFRRLQAKSARRRPKAHVVGGGNIILDPYLAARSPVWCSSTSSRRERTHLGTAAVRGVRRRSQKCAAEESGACMAASQMRTRLGDALTFSKGALIVQAWFALDAPRFRALLPASWADLALVSGWVLIF